MSEPKPAGLKRARAPYSRLICLGCRERRIRCELPSEVEVPNPGELRTVQTPCYRCKRLGIPCVIRQTVLGRPSILHDETKRVNSSVVLRPKICPSDDLSSNQGVPIRWNGGTLLIHTPQSTDMFTIVSAIDTIRYEHVEEQWFRHLPAHFGHTKALDLSIKAIVVACAYARGVPKLTSSDCYQALALALNAVQANIKQSQGKPNDDILASTALLAPFEGVVKRNGIATRLHIEALAAILAARPATYPVTPLAREILDFNACESAITACIHDTPSPFENVPPSYFANDRMGCHDSDQGQLRALSTELFIRIPRLVKLVRSLRLQQSTEIQQQLAFEAFRLSESLVKLQDSQAEERLLQNVKQVHPSSYPYATSSRLRESLQFATIKDFEALAYYWQSRLSVLRLEWRLHDLSVSTYIQADNTNNPGISFRPTFGPRADEMSRLAKNILMCSQYAAKLVLFKHHRLLAHAMVVVWGVTRDIPGVLSIDQDGEGTDALSPLLLRRVNSVLHAKPDLTADDMDTAADIFVGGPPEGRFAELYSL